MPTPASADPAAASRLAALASAHAAGALTDHSLQTIRTWLAEPRYGDFAAALGDLIDKATVAAVQGDMKASWKDLDDAFWTVIPFGTGGRRGKMFPVGSNSINDRTIGESAQGLADYVRGILPTGATPTCAIAYDTRHRSEHFARLCAEVLLAAGFRIFFLRGYRSTPELSFAVRHTQATCGIMVTASHNPPSDNAVKVYWSGGVQVLPPHDRGIIDRVMSVDAVERSDFAAGVGNGRVQFVEEEVDAAFVAAVIRQSSPGPRDVSILYTPLHGVGASAVVPVLRGAGFTRIRLYGPQETPDGDFPNVPGHVSNPENPAVMDGAVTEARARGDDLVMASDPDCDRLGASAPVTPGSAEWRAFTGNQLAALLTDWVLSSRARSGTLSPRDRVVTTLVTSGLVRRIAQSRGAAITDWLQVGFKWIGEEIDRIGPEHFAFGCEESHGYLAGTHVRDKDASVAALLLAELTAALKQDGRSIHEDLDRLFVAHGCHAERQVSVTLPGAAGMDRMREIMASLRQTPPSRIAGLDVVRVRDYGSLTVTVRGQPSRPFPGPPHTVKQGDLVMFDLAGVADSPPRAGDDNPFPALANCVAARPSGTEPKIKFYLFAAAPPGPAGDLALSKQLLAERLDCMERDLRALAGV
jgi:phosphoglucomutase/phosphomannomutase